MIDWLIGFGIVIATLVILSNSIALDERKRRWKNGETDYYGNERESD